MREAESGVIFFLVRSTKEREDGKCKLCVLGNGDHQSIVPPTHAYFNEFFFFIDDFNENINKITKFKFIFG